MKQKAPKRSDAKTLNDLRLRALQVRGGFLALGTDSYMPFIEAQAMKEGKALSAADKLEIRQIINGRAYPSGSHWLELVERALETQKSA